MPPAPFFLHQSRWGVRGGCAVRASGYGLGLEMAVRVKSIVFPLAVLSTALSACRGRAADPPSDAATVPVVRLPVRAPREKLSPTLRRLLDAGAATERRLVLLELARQVDLMALGDSLRRRGATRLERRAAVVDALQSLASRSQAALAPLLERLRRRGSVGDVRGYAVGNTLLVDANPTAVRLLAEREDVARLVEETERDVRPLMGGQTTRRPTAVVESWALDAIGVAAAWARGLDGRSVVVGIIDAGASAWHEQLLDGFRGGDSSWYDPAGSRPMPVDALTGHGTGILSVAVGRNAGGPGLGVAPGARWVACVGLPGGRYNNVTLIECADWMLTTAQPDVLINAWLLPEPGCDRSLARIVDAWRAAEILPVFPAGNDGPGERTDRSPANYGGLFPGASAALAVGGLASPDAVFERSGRGPSSCDGSTYPSVAAPADDVTIAFPLTRSSYIQSHGTSLATGFVAGAAAILLQAHPEASVWELEAGLTSGAADRGSPGPDNVYGYGALDVPGALTALGRLLKDAANRTSETPMQR